MNLKNIFIRTIALTFLGCKHADKQPCDDHFIKAYNYVLSFDLDRGLSEFDKATNQNPKNAFAYYGKGSIALLNGDYEKQSKNMTRQYKLTQILFLDIIIEHQFMPLSDNIKKQLTI